MKKVSYLALASMFIFASCKKDWSCNCTMNGNTNQVESYSGFTKKSAESKCSSTEKDFQEIDSSVSCELKKK